MLTDKLLLVIAAVAIGCLLIGTIFFLEDYLVLSKEWVIFVLMGVGYFVTVVYSASKFGKSFTRRKAYMLYVMSVTLIILLLTFLLFFFHVIPMPNYLLPYTGAIIILAPIPILAAKRMTKRISREKRPIETKKWDRYT